MNLEKKECFISVIAREKLSAIKDFAFTSLVPTIYSIKKTRFQFKVRKQS